jgi:serine/threonine protein kinase
LINLVGRQIGNYRLVHFLGRGGFADVYLGEHRYLNNYAALKLIRTSLDEEDVEGFLSEAQTLARLTHPYIVRVLEFTVENGMPVLIMAYAQGGTVRKRHPRGYCLSLALTVAYVNQAAEALQYAHNHNIIHRDIKPENMLFDTDQQHLLLSDFGLAVFAHSPDLITTQEMAGTLPYMAPEQLRGKPTFASDQYSLAICAYEWLCGVRPFEGTHWQVVAQQVSSAPPRLRERIPLYPRPSRTWCSKHLPRIHDSAIRVCSCSLRH